MVPNENCIARCVLDTASSLQPTRSCLAPFRAQEAWQDVWLLLLQRLPTCQQQVKNNYSLLQQNTEVNIAFLTYISSKNSKGTARKLNLLKLPPFLTNCTRALSKQL